MATWYWKSDLRKKETDSSCWEAYSEDDNKRLEKAYNKGQSTMKFNEKYKIDFKEMIQFRITVLKYLIYYLNPLFLTIHAGQR